MRIPRYYLFASVFLTGAAILVIEIVGARIISPYFGVSLYVWSSLITVTLVSLALGYWYGGKTADLQEDEGELFAAVFKGAVYLLIVPFIKGLVLTKAGSLGLRMGALMSSFILFGVPLFYLGIASPYAVKLIARTTEGAGKATGIVFAVSTAGSFTGAILTGFFLIPLLHVDKVVALVSLVLILLCIFPQILQRNIRRLVFSLAVLAACLFVLFHSTPLPQSKNAKVIYREESPYGEISVVDSNDRRNLLINGIVHGGINVVSGMPVDRYFYFMDALARAYHPRARRGLMIGLGIGALPKIMDKRDICFDVVDIDPLIVSTAGKYFGFRKERAGVYIQDGRFFIESTEKTYDCIFLDAYASEALAYHLFSAESFAAMKRILNEGGILIINFHDFSDNTKAISTRAIFKTLKVLFNDVLVFEVQTWHDSRFRNIVFLASKSLLKPEGPLIYTDLPEGMPEIRLSDTVTIEGEGIILSDGYNPIDKMYNPVAESMRKITQQALLTELTKN